MGVLKNGLLGDFSGRLGNLVIYKMHGKTVVRSFPTVKQKKATGKRKQYQDDFGHVMGLMQMAAKFINVGWKPESKESSPFKKAFSFNLKLYRDLGRPESLEWLQLSNGSRAGAKDIKMNAISDQEFLLSWGEAEADKNFSADDRVWVLLVNERDQSGYYFGTICLRSHGEVLLKTTLFNKEEPLMAFVCFGEYSPANEYKSQNVSNSQFVRLI